MEKRKSPKGFIVVLPGEIIEIPQDSDKSWLTLFYSLPRELAEKWKPAYDLPRCPYEVLRTDKYDHIVCDDMFKLLVWDCYAWCAWQFFQVKDRKGNYRDTVSYTHLDVYKRQTCTCTSSSYRNDKPSWVCTPFSLDWSAVICFPWLTVYALSLIHIWPI